MEAKILVESLSSENYQKMALAFNSPIHSSKVFRQMVPHATITSENYQKMALAFDSPIHSSKVFRQMVPHASITIRKYMELIRNYFQCCRCQCWPQKFFTQTILVQGKRKWWA